MQVPTFDQKSTGRAQVQKKGARIESKPHRGLQMHLEDGATRRASVSRDRGDERWAHHDYM